MIRRPDQYSIGALAVRNKTISSLVRKETNGKDVPFFTCLSKISLCHSIGKMRSCARKYFFFFVQVLHTKQNCILEERTHSISIRNIGKLTQISVLQFHEGTAQKMTERQF